MKVCDLPDFISTEEKPYSKFVPTKIWKSEASTSSHQNVLAKTIFKKVKEASNYINLVSDEEIETTECRDTPINLMSLRHKNSLMKLTSDLNKVFQENSDFLNENVFHQEKTLEPKKDEASNSIENKIAKIPMEEVTEGLNQEEEEKTKTKSIVDLSNLECKRKTAEIQMINEWVKDYPIDSKFEQFNKPEYCKPVKKNYKAVRWGRTEDRKLFLLLRKLEKEDKINIEEILQMDADTEAYGNHGIHLLAQKFGWKSLMKNLVQRIQALYKKDFSVREIKLLKQILKKEFNYQNLDYEKILFHFPGKRIQRLKEVCDQIIDCRRSKALSFFKITNS